MNAQASLSSSHIERVAEELLSVDAADMRFLAVYFEEEFPLYELRYTFAYSFSRPRTFADEQGELSTLTETTDISRFSEQSSKPIE